MSTEQAIAYHCHQLTFVWHLLSVGTPKYIYLFIYLINTEIVQQYTKTGKKNTKKK